jgi:hypothetical protein
MSNTVVIVIVVLVLVVGGYLLLNKGGVNYTMPTQNTTTTTTNTTQQPLPTAAGVEVSLNSQNNSSELGNAILNDSSGKLTVKIALKGEPDGASQPAHIHLGSCPTPGVVKYPLTSVVSGASDTTLDTTITDLKKLGPLAINVHMSDKQMNQYVACGDIKF